jgi:membrane-associated phospholipid phosphatase
MDLLAETISASNILVFLWAVWRLPLDYRPLLIIVGVMWLVHFVKMMVREPRPSILCGLSYGMPSGHAAVAVAAWYLVAKTYGWPVWLFVMSAGLLMTWSRNKMQCHTVAQGIIGSIVGFVSASSGYAII